MEKQFTPEMEELFRKCARKLIEETQLILKAHWHWRFDG